MKQCLEGWKDIMFSAGFNVLRTEERIVTPIRSRCVQDLLDHWSKLQSPETYFPCIEMRSTFTKVAEKLGSKIG